MLILCFRLNWCVLFLCSLAWGWGAVKWNSRPGPYTRSWRKACPRNRGGEIVLAVLQMDTCTPILKPRPHSCLPLVSWESSVNEIVPLLTADPQSPLLLWSQAGSEIIGEEVRELPPRVEKHTHTHTFTRTHTPYPLLVSFHLPAFGKNSLNSITCF